MQGIIFIIFLLTFGALYYMAFALVKPFRLNKKRPVSTLSLKVTYLGYLAVLMVFILLLIFFQPSADDDSSSMRDIILIIAASLVPNLGIIVRREFQSVRVGYNYIFTAINIVAALYLFYSIMANPWTI